MKQVCDRLTVLRDGKYVGDADVPNTSMDEIVRMMVGRNVEYLPGEYHKGSEVVARVESLTRLKRIPGTMSVALRGMSLEIRKGEVREEPNWLARAVWCRSFCAITSYQDGWKFGLQKMGIRR